MKVNPSEIFPTQDFLKPGTIRYILDCINNNHEEDLPPTPIVRKDNESNLLAVDGHNLIAVMLHLEREIEVHLAESALDGLEVNADKDAARNEELAEKYDEILSLRTQTVANGIGTFRDLINQNSELFDAD